MDFEKKISLLKINNTSKLSVLDYIKKTHSNFLNKFDFECCKKLQNMILEIEDDDCFDEFVKLYLHFKDEKDFSLLIFECKSKYFINFYKYLDKLKNIKIFKDNLFLWEQFMIDYFNSF